MSRLDPLTLLFILLLNLLNSAYAIQMPAIGKDAVVVTAQHLATQVGVDILKQGGNAIDAAVGIGYALAVVNPCCGNLGGGGFMLIHFANGQDTFINFREKAPKNISPALFLDAQGRVKSVTGNYLEVGVPGTVMGLNTALKEYGSLPLKTVISPAIQLSKEGFILTPDDVELLNVATDSFKTQTNVADIFLQNGKPFQAGNRLVQKDLANTLSLIANKGNEAFYQGSIADEIVAASQKNQGVLTKQDFANYSIEEGKPLYCNYRNYPIITTPPPGGGIILCEMLNIIEGYSISQLGYHTAASVHATTQAMRFAFEDRNKYLGDPDFVTIPITRLLSKEYAAEIRERVSVRDSEPTQSPSPYPHNKCGASSLPQAREGNNTTSYVVVDKYGNVVSVTYTINDYFGAQIIAGKTGFFLNNEMDDFTIKTDTPNIFGLIQGPANLIAANKRPFSSMSPTIMLNPDHRFYMTLGTPGGSTIPTQLLQVIQNVIDFRIRLQSAVDAPRYHMQWRPDIVFMEPYALSQPVLDKLTAMGYHFQLGSPWGSRQWGAVTAIVKDPKNGLLIGAMDSREPAGLASGLKR
jgi:gamma-glutamyltranspeptidase / glutathione hydrolase